MELSFWYSQAVEIIPIIILGFVSILSINNKAEDILGVNSSDIKTMPDNLFNKVKYIAMDNNGIPLYTVSSPKMKQFIKVKLLRRIVQTYYYLEIINLQLRLLPNLAQ